ncbi:BC1881 family protein [Alkalihalobacillus pseudalcaliphilus]|uniref:BC1881 family protein n=1 Tax=Alkalihalobacillus pseudalcaliphilus TaxID=79884 RepID=UPI00069F8D19|nr:BC1881 family protein [Alkalihalobacillus pseudalcaliphilus]
MAESNRGVSDEVTKSRSIGEITAKVSVDCSEAISGLKAVQREARKATQELRELESTKSEGIVETLREYHRIQGYDGNWNHDDYMRGMYNAFEMLVAQVDGRVPEFKETPHTSDFHLYQVPTADLVAELARREGVKEIAIQPHQPFEISRVEPPFGKVTDEESGSARVLVVTD